ncbi:MAG: transposase, partial [Aquificaceae bacterium]|nr:transposase [Aquificaceae bacterium]
MRERRRKQSQELIKRGEILIDPDVIQLKQQKEKKLGRPYKYPRALLLLFLFFRSTLRLPYRQTEDLVKNILKQLEPS